MKLASLLLIVVIIATNNSCNYGPKSSKKATESSKQFKARPVSNNNRESGVLILHTDSADRKKTNFSILNLDGSNYTSIKSVLEEEPSSKKIDGKILAYYPEYYVIHFNASVFSDSLYSIEIGKDRKLIKKGAYVEYLTWPNYILRFFVMTNESNPLRSEPNSKSELVKNLNYNELSFRCIEISGEWVKLICNIDCEGCPDNKKITGWIKWKENGKIILRQYYTC